MRDLCWKTLFIVLGCLFLGCNGIIDINIGFVVGEFQSYKNGTMEGAGGFHVLDSAIFDADIAVVWNNQRQEFVAVFALEYENEQDIRYGILRIVRFDENGRVINNRTQIVFDSPLATCKTPSIHLNTQLNQYLVVWEYTESALEVAFKTSKVKSIILDEFGNFATASKTIFEDGTSIHPSKMLYLPHNDSFVVACGKENFSKFEGLILAFDFNAELLWKYEFQMLGHPTTNVLIAYDDLSNRFAVTSEVQFPDVHITCGLTIAASDLTSFNYSQATCFTRDILSGPNYNFTYSPNKGLAAHNGSFYTILQVGPNRGNNMIRFYELDSSDYSIIKSQYLSGHISQSEYEFFFFDDNDQIVIYGRNFGFQVLTFPHPLGSPVVNDIYVPNNRDFLYPSFFSVAFIPEKNKFFSIYALQPGTTYFGPPATTTDRPLPSWATTLASTTNGDNNKDDSSFLKGRMFVMAMVVGVVVVVLVALIVMFVVYRKRKLAASYSKLNHVEMENVQDDE